MKKINIDDFRIEEGKKLDLHESFGKNELLIVLTDLHISNINKVSVKLVNRNNSDKNKYTFKIDTLEINAYSYLLHASN